MIADEDPLQIRVGDAFENGQNRGNTQGEMRSRGRGKADILQIRDTNILAYDYLPHTKIGKGMKMKALIIACIMVSPFLVGCSTTYYVPRISDAEEFVDAQAKVQGRSAIVTLVDGTEIRLDSTSLNPDSVVGVMEDTPIRQELLLSQVKEIETMHVGRGAERGGMNGFIGGGGYGLLMGAASLGDQSSMVKTGADVLVLGLYSGLFGAIIGSLGGMAFLSTEHYIFSADTIATFSSQETKRRDGTTPRYVLEVEKFAEETEYFVAITWQGKTVKLPKSEITIEKHEGGFRITVPARLLQ